MYLWPIQTPPNCGPKTPVATLGPRGRWYCLARPNLTRTVLLQGLGASGDIVNGMISEGYDANVINGLSILGATDAQLQYLWDNFGAGTPEFRNAATEMGNKLAAAFVAPSRPSTVQTQPPPQLRAGSWWDQSPLGVKNSTAVAVGSGVFLLTILLRPRR